MVDLAINQIIQEGVEEKERGSVGAVQTSINNIFSLTKFTVVILFNDISQYGFLVIMSVSAVLISFCMYLMYTLRQVCLKYSRVPSENPGPFRKSMIQMSAINQNESDDSFKDAS